VHFKISGRLGAKATVIAKRIPSTVNARVNRLIEERADLRENKNWQRADEIRNKLAEVGVILKDTNTGVDVTYNRVPSEESLNSLIEELGISLEDTPQGTVWRRKR
jgi:cysteinyl-tRNA synthetase